MCGIAGIIGNREDRKEIIEKMVEVIHYRGPDEKGTFSDEFIAFGMRRLSIIDLGGGKQPIENEDMTLSIIFNGEIYNYQELYSHLIEKGHKFKTHSDTEVLIHLYEEYAEKMLPMLRGMFVFSIYDKMKKRIFIARDYFGIKPLYYLTNDKTVLAYGSEIKSLLVHPEYKRDINDAAVFNYLSYQYNPLEETMFKNIWKLAPGSYMNIDLIKGKIVEKKYWTYTFNKERNHNEKELRTKIVETMKDSVKAHMIADVPVGAFLSGGIDSAIICSLMSKETDKKINTFTVGFKEVSEHKEAKEMADFIGTKHTELEISFDKYLEVLPKIAYHFDEPVADPSAVGLYFLAEEASKHVKVVLSGEGADELFGGYNIYREPFALSVLNILPKFIREKIIRPLSNSKNPFYGRNYLQRFFKPLEKRYIGNAHIFKSDDIEKLWLHDKKPDSLSLESFYKNIENLEDSERMQLVDINYWLVGDILQKADKMTMAHSLELRVPFLDREVSSLSETIGAKSKWKKGQTKYILRQAFKNLIPKKTAKRKKLGFPTSLRFWMKENIKSFEEVMVNNTYIKKNFKIGFIKHLIKEHAGGKTDNSRKIYLLYMLALWYNTFFENASQ